MGLHPQMRAQGVPDLVGHKNQELRYQLGLVSPNGIPRDQISPHRAASDVVITAAILEELIKLVFTRRTCTRPCEKSI
jgi:hypothetical protein